MGSRSGSTRGRRCSPAGFVEIYPPHGKYQLVVQEVEPRGAGAMALLLQQIKERLQAEGLLDPARKRRLPFIPRRVGVATSPSGAALRDFLRVLHGRFPSIPVLVAPCRVQGEGAAATVVSAVRALCRARVDVIVVTRGGGSQEDLGAFNDERLARAIAACPVPVVSAVGHEVDVTVADLVADVRAATPTHAAQLVAPVTGRARRVARVRSPGAPSAPCSRGSRGGGARSARSAPRSSTRSTSSRASGTASTTSPTAPRAADAGARSRAARQRLDGLRARLGRQEPRRRVREVLLRMEAATRRLGAWQAAYFRREGLRLERLGSRLEPANVAKLLARGFALVLRDGRLVTRSADAAPDDAVRIALAEGWLDARVTSRDHGRGPAARSPRGARAGRSSRPPAGRALTPSGGAVNG